MRWASSYLLIWFTSTYHYIPSYLWHLLSSSVFGPYISPIVTEKFILIPPISLHAVVLYQFSRLFKIGLWFIIWLHNDIHFPEYQWCNSFITSYFSLLYSHFMSRVFITTGFLKCVTFIKHFSDFTDFISSCKCPIYILVSIMLYVLIKHINLLYWFQSILTINQYEVVFYTSSVICVCTHNRFSIYLCFCLETILKLQPYNNHSIITSPKPLICNNRLPETPKSIPKPQPRNNQPTNTKP